MRSHQFATLGVTKQLVISKEERYVVLATFNIRIVQSRILAKNLTNLFWIPHELEPGA
jgi:hypothetical protein